MKSPIHISSTQNKLIKNIILLKEKSRERRKTGLFVLEGLREFQLALKGGYEVKQVFFEPSIVSLNEINALIESFSGKPDIIEISKEVYKKIAYRETTEGVLAIAKAKSHELKTIQFKNKAPLILVAEAPEKPGNIGALLRTADAANVDTVFIANPKTDLYNPNIIRSSVGCVFTRNIGTGTTQELISYLKEKNIAIYCAALTASKNYLEVNFKEASALVVGTESTGLTDTWLENSTQNVIIPMEGEIDSMNVSVSAAILIFEAKRQRKIQ
ncbi:TrmH family RNA methyltransferase [Saonia flava]|uniref:TrmH family RNA methyltransferase n=1 Tax=Saonia flava TaxID=523696 RepID=A0A846QWC9_9FLAO|nr:RNA methyltransferase [Saonia flava]NJB72288.1 TrmH family RNA methyltransferase [Saonia flava]